MTSANLPSAAQPAAARPRAPALRPGRARRWTVLHLAAGLVGLGLLWRTLRYALGFPAWGDEAFLAINVALRDFRGLLAPLVYGQIAPLGFTWAELAVSRGLGLSEWALRALPFLAGVAALLLVRRFARRTLPRGAELPAVGIFAVSYYLVRHGSEIKPYATDLLVALGLTVLAWAVVQRPRAPGRWLALLLAAAVAVWCSYPAVFVGGGIGLVLLLLPLREGRDREGAVLDPGSGPGARDSGTEATPHPEAPSGSTHGPLPGDRRRTRRSGAAARLALAAYWLAFSASTLAMYRVYAKPHADYAAGRLAENPMWRRAFPPLREPWKLLLWLPAIHTGEMLAYPVGGRPPGSIVTLVLVVAGSVRLWRRDRTLLLLLLAPLPLTFLAAGFKAYPYGSSARISLYMAPAFCLLAGLGLHTLLRAWQRAGGPRLRTTRLACAGLLAAIALGGMIADLLRPYKSEAVYRSARAVRSVAARTAGTDRWIIFNADRPVPYAPYLGDWRGVGGQFVFDALRAAPPDAAWAPPPETVAPHPGSTWLLVYHADSGKVRFPQAQLDTYLGVLAQRLGPPQVETHPVKDEPGKHERIEVYHFAPSPPAAP